jgi:hypothetical protein
MLLKELEKAGVTSALIKLGSEKGIGMHNLINFVFSSTN